MKAMTPYFMVTLLLSFFPLKMIFFKIFVSYFLVLKMVQSFYVFTITNVSAKISLFNV